MLPIPEGELNAEDMEEFASCCLGKLLFVFSRIELNLTLHLVAMSATARMGASEAALSNCHFAGKLDFFLCFVDVLHQERTDFLRACHAWHAAAKSISLKRNRFAHGRWAILPYTQQVVHVSGYPGGHQDEVRYALEDLRAIVLEAENVHAQLLELINKQLC
ncbi:hypothetical protein [Janthinobacterium sp. EB271-G4-7A]|uniref:hypothetical protein n=1 Tax=Janthinobacterium sp. EB271-G4-7A TaxID=2775056 RepID=UPI001E59BC33|nr:hypothetical protein [Janthinobacterium sp. EB271-G4-7A]MCC7697689.1 hypothetical protein [Janthinobacterium sp. EB271-G4-7A]